MARLPSRADLSGPASFRSGKPIASYDTSALGRGIEKAGADIMAFGRQRQQQSIALDGAATDGSASRARNDLERTFDGATDYDKFGTRYDEGIRGIVQKYGPLIRDRQARAIWENNFTQQSLAGRERVLNLSDGRQKELRLGNAKIGLEGYQSVIADANATDDERTKARTNAEAFVNELQQTGDLTPTEAEQWRRDVVEGGNFVYGQRMINRDGPNAIVSDAHLPAGMRNNNPGNIKYVGQGANRGVVGPSQNTDQGDPQAVFTTPEAGMAEAYRLARSKYDGGKKTANELIAGNGGWTPGNTQAAINIAELMGLGPADDLHLDDPKQAAKFMRGLVRQEHGPASDAYSDEMITNAVTGRVGAPASDGRVQPTVQLSGLPGFAQANSFLKTRIVNHGPDHIDGLQTDMQQRLAAFIQAAPPGMSEKLGIFSGARTVARQTELWNEALKKYGSAGEARKWVAPPPGVMGSKGSNHNHGEAADLSYDGKSLANAPPEVVKWAHENAGRFGLAFPLGNENWHVEMVEARGGAPSAVNRPQWFKDLPPEKQLQLEQMAETRQRQLDNEAAAQSKVDQGAARDDYSLRIATADPLLTRQQILDDPRIDNGDKANLINTFDTKMKEVTETAAAIQAFRAGGLSVDPFDEKGRKIADNVFDTSLKAIGADKAQPLAEEVVHQTGVVPKQALNVIRGGSQSTSVADVMAAGQAAQRISSINPAALSRRDGGAEVQTFADDFSHYVTDLNLSPEEAAQRIIANRDPTKKLAKKALEPAAKEFVKQMGDVDLPAALGDSGVFGGDAALGMTPAQELGIKAEFSAIAEDAFYATNGDPDLAKNRAIEQMKRLYGATEFGEKTTIVKYPPERYWPQQKTEGGPFGVGADPWSYAKTQLMQDVTAASPDYQPGSVQLVTTPETDAMIKRGEMPGYAVMWKDANGVLQTMPGKLWRPDPTKIQAIDAANAAREQQLRVDDAQAKRPLLWQSPQDLLGGNDPVFGDRDAPPTQSLVPAQPPTPPAPVIDGSSDLLEPTPGNAM